MMTNNNTTYKDSPLGKIPVDWEVERFDKLCEVILDGTHFSPQSKAGPYKYITSKNIRNDGLDLDNVNYVSEKDHREIYKRCPVKFNDILLTKDGAGTGACCKNTLTEEFSLLSSVAVLRVNIEKINNEFLIQFIKSPSGQKIIQDEISGQAITRITLEKIKYFRIVTPPLPEQKRIAQLLTTWDEAITKTNQLIAQKELRKKWLMQQLLTGKKRLKGFSEEWTEYKLKDCFHFIKSYSISREGLSRDQGIIYCIHYGDIHALYDTEFLDFKTQAGIPKIIDNKICVHPEANLVDGDIIMADASEDYNGVGEAVEVINIENKIVVSGLHTIVLRDFSGVTEDLFRAYLFDSEKVRNELRKKATGTSVYSVTKITLESLVFNLPPLDEQTSIAQVLQSADKEIQILKSMLEKMKEQKKGLMQVLLMGKKRLIGVNTH